MVRPEVYPGSLVILSGRREPKDLVASIDNRAEFLPLRSAVRTFAQDDGLSER